MMRGIQWQRLFCTEASLSNRIPMHVRLVLDHRHSCTCGLITAAQFDMKGGHIVINILNNNQHKTGRFTGWQRHFRRPSLRHKNINTSFIFRNRDRSVC
jgi:hypothetical protein